MYNSKKKLEIRYGTKKAKIKGQKRQNRSYSSLDGIKSSEDCLSNDQANFENHLREICSLYEINIPLEKFKKGGNN